MRNKIFRHTFCNREYLKKLKRESIMSNDIYYMSQEK